MSEMNENKKMPCAVARDLMPLYVENLTEDETTEMMREHIAECAACAQSFGMQKTKLEIEKKPQRPDFRGIRFFKKSFLKRIALWMAIIIMGFIAVWGSCLYLFDNYWIEREDIRVVGQYQLSDGRIIIAIKADGYSVNELTWSYHTWEDNRIYEYVDGQRKVKTENELSMDGNAYLVSDRFTIWTRSEDERGDVFYYVFDPNREVEAFYASWKEVTSMQAVATTQEELEEAEMKPVLRYLSINDWIVWRQGDPLREVTAEEEKVLLEAVQKASNIEGSIALPKEDILDTLMGE